MNSQQYNEGHGYSQDCYNKEQEIRTLDSAFKQGLNLEHGGGQGAYYYERHVSYSAPAAVNTYPGHAFPPQYNVADGNSKFMSPPPISHNSAYFTQPPQYQMYREHFQAVRCPNYQANPFYTQQTNLSSRCLGVSPTGVYNNGSYSTPNLQGYLAQQAALRTPFVNLPNYSSHYTYNHHLQPPYRAHSFPQREDLACRSSNKANGNIRRQMVKETCHHDCCNQDLSQKHDGNVLDFKKERTEYSLFDSKTIYVSDNEDDIKGYQSCYIESHPKMMPKSVLDARKQERERCKAIYSEYREFENLPLANWYQKSMEPQFIFRDEEKYLEYMHKIKARMTTNHTNRYSIVFYTVSPLCLLDKYGVVRSTFRKDSALDSLGICEKFSIPRRYRDRFPTPLYALIRDVIENKDNLFHLTEGLYKDPDLNDDFIITHAIFIPFIAYESLFDKQTGLINPERLYRLCSTTMFGGLEDCFSLNIKITQDLEFLRKINHTNGW